MERKYYVERLAGDVWCRVDWFCNLGHAMQFCGNCDWLIGSKLRIVYVEEVENVLAVIDY